MRTTKPPPPSFGVTWKKSSDYGDCTVWNLYLDNPKARESDHFGGIETCADDYERSEFYRAADTEPLRLAQVRATATRFTVAWVLGFWRTGSKAAVRESFLQKVDGSLFYKPDMI